MSIPPLVLTHERAMRLLDYIQAYRRLALTQLLPSQDRNTHQRRLQGLQGKLIPALERLPAGSPYMLPLTREDIAALLAMVTDLRTRQVQEPASEQRDATLLDLIALKAILDKLGRAGTPAYPTRSLL